MIKLLFLSLLVLLTVGCSKQNIYTEKVSESTPPNDANNNSVVEAVSDISKWVKCENSLDGYSILLPSDFKPWTQLTSIYDDSTPTTCPVKTEIIGFSNGTYAIGGDINGKVLNITTHKEKKYSDIDSYIFSEVTDKKNELQEFMIDNQKSYRYTAYADSKLTSVITLIKGYPVEIAKSRDSEEISDADFNAIIKNIHFIK